MVKYDFPLAALRHPWASGLFLLGYRQKLQDAIILDAAQYLFGRSACQTWQQALSEVNRRELDSMNAIPPAGLGKVVGNLAETTLGKFLYASVRVLQPPVVVETGVAHGVSSWMILNAMEKNGFGTLHSIDLPDHDTIQAYNMQEQAAELRTGWVIPSGLRHRWQLHLGTSREILPELLADLKQIPYFFHDSDHSYENMNFEYQSIWQYLQPGGLIVSDDIWKNTAYSEFVTRSDCQAAAFRKGGVIRKTNEKLATDEKQPAHVLFLTGYDPRRARTNQVSDMVVAYGYATACQSVTLVTADTQMPNRLDRSKVFSAYGLPEIFKIKYLPTFLSDDTGVLRRNLMLIFAHFFYALGLFWRILFSGSERSVRWVVISKNPNLLLPYLALRKVFGKLYPIGIVAWLHEVVNKRQYAWVYRQSDICLATNQTIAEDIISQYQVNPQRCQVVCNPIPEKFLGQPVANKVSLRRRLDLPEQQPLVVYTGKLYLKQAEARYLFDTAACLPHILFLLTGGKPEVVAHNRAECQGRGLTNVLFTGFLDDYTAVRDYQLAADVLVSYYSAKDHNVRHNFPNKLFEYMSSGNVVVTADYPALRPFCHAGNVVLVEPENPAALADALNKILSDPTRRQRLAQAALKTAQKWTVEQVAQRTVAFILQQAVSR